MICRVCGARFEDTELTPTTERHPYGDGYATEEVGYDCPYCGAMLVNEGVCRRCDEEVARCELEEGLCRYCVEETRQSLDWMWGLLDPAQKVWAASHDEWMTGT